LPSSKISFPLPFLPHALRHCKICSLFGRSPSFGNIFPHPKELVPGFFSPGCGPFSVFKALWPPGQTKIRRFSTELVVNSFYFLAAPLRNPQASRLAAHDMSFLFWEDSGSPSSPLCLSPSLSSFSTPLILQLGMIPSFVFACANSFLLAFFFSPNLTMLSPARILTQSKPSFFFSSPSGWTNSLDLPSL